VRVFLRPASVASARLDGRCEIQVGELTDVDALTRALTDVQAVVYAAGAVRGRSYRDFAPANVLGVEALLAALGRTGTGESHVVLMSSLAAGRPELSDSARSKRAGEDALRGAGLPNWSILRPPAVYGPGDVEMSPVLKLARSGVAVCPGPVDQRLALIHVFDLVRAVAACLDHAGSCRQQCFAVDDGKPGGYDWHEIGQAMAGRPVRQVTLPRWLIEPVARGNLLAASIFGYAPMLTPGKVRELQQSRWLCDNRAFTLATGWRPEIDLATGARTL
jgi:2-alkyl-3-oxoalkanoate reductase